MATMDPGQRGFGQQQRFNTPGLPFDIGADPLSQMRPRPQGGMRPQSPPLPPGGGQIPPELLEMLMAMLMDAHGGRRATPMPTSPPMPPGGRRATPMPTTRGGQRPPMGGGRPPMGRPPMGGPQRGGQRPPMGGGRPPVIKIEDLVRALSGSGAQRQAPQANMAVPQARR